MYDASSTCYRSILRLQLVVYVIIAIFNMALVYGQLSSGSPISCTKEGEIIHIPLISDNPCITCLCENKIIRCVKKACQSNEGCYMILFNKPKNSCCDVCKGCIYKNKPYKSGQEWTEPNNPCLSRSCRAGVVSRSKLQCYTPCSHPTKVPGQCCPSCRGCSFEGHTRKEGSYFSSKQHPCVQCQCQGGSVSCTKKACPVLNCPNNKIQKADGDCCPTCVGKRKFFDFKTGSCLFRNRVYSPRMSFKPDKCTKCTCDAGTTVCEAQNCPVITCPPVDVIQEKGSCCRKCLQKPKLNCTSQHGSYVHGQVWNSNVCTGCSCNDGLMRCNAKDCRHLKKCRVGYELKYEKGVCCPKCVQVGAVCSVFGDPHYTTFDGKIFNYQGTCKYLLASDCVGKTFSVRVRNSGRQNRLYTWTQVVIIDIDNTRINLLRYLGVKVNKRYVTMPYTDNRLFSVVRRGYAIIVKLNIGVEITWDGDSYLEVKVSSQYKSRMCGLCGNFNGDKDDDFTGRSGKVFTNETQYGDSWRLGGERSCRKRSKNQQVVQKSCKQNTFLRYRAERKCGVFRDPALAPCMRVVKPGSFIRSCVADSCNCPFHKPCHCEAVRAFARACIRAGVPVQLTGILQKCQAPACPRGARYSMCGSGCVKTCEDHVSGNPFTCTKSCVEGCHCPRHRVWFNNRCVKPVRCANLLAKKARKAAMESVVNESRLAEPIVSGDTVKLNNLNVKKSLNVGITKNAYIKDVNKSAKNPKAIRGKRRRHTRNRSLRRKLRRRNNKKSKKAKSKIVKKFSGAKINTENRKS